MAVSFYASGVWPSMRSSISESHLKGGRGRSNQARESRSGKEKGWQRASAGRSLCSSHPPPDTPTKRRKTSLTGSIIAGIVIIATHKYVKNSVRFLSPPPAFKRVRRGLRSCNKVSGEGPQTSSKFSCVDNLDCV